MSQNPGFLGVEKKKPPPLIADGGKKISASVLHGGSSQNPDCLLLAAIGHGQCSCLRSSSTPDFASIFQLPTEVQHVHSPWLASGAANFCPHPKRPPEIVVVAAAAVHATAGIEATAVLLLVSSLLRQYHDEPRTWLIGRW